MHFRDIFPVGRQRRLINLRIRPALQLKLPAFLLAVTAVFAAIFLAHTRAAYGTLVDVSLAEPWLRGLVGEISRDYYVVSASIGVAYSATILAACLAMTHKMLGPIDALERHVESLNRGNYRANTRLRSGHPLSGLATELNALSEQLRREAEGDDAEESASEDGPKPAQAPSARLAANAVDELLGAYGSQDRRKQQGASLEPRLAPLAP